MTSYRGKTDLQVLLTVRMKWNAIKMQWIASPQLFGLPQYWALDVKFFLSVPSWAWAKSGGTWIRLLHVCSIRPLQTLHGQTTGHYRIPILKYQSSCEVTVSIVVESLLDFRRFRLTVFHFFQPTPVRGENWHEAATSFPCRSFFLNLSNHRNGSALTGPLTSVSSWTEFIRQSSVVALPEHSFPLASFSSH